MSQELIPQDLKQIYYKAYQEELEKRKGTGYVIKDEISGRVYHESNFFLCGWVTIRFFANTSMNRKLLKWLRSHNYSVSSAYGDGFRFAIDRPYRNGDFEIASVAIGKVAGYLNSLGFDVFVESNLD